MRIGVGLPTTLPGTGSWAPPNSGRQLVDWARLAEQGPFSSLGVLDRLVYDSYAPFIALSAAAAATERLKLATTIVIGPLQSTALLAKAAASLDALSGGRLVLGLAVGARKEDYDAAGVPFRTRGRVLQEQLSTLRDIWEEGKIVPKAVRAGGPEILVGGLSDVSYARMVRYADGYVHGGGPPRAFARAADKARAAWYDAGRIGRPQLWAQGYFAFGDEAAEAGARYLRHYYAFTGPFAERIAAGLLTTPQAVASFMRGYAEAGCDELVLFPTSNDLSQLEQLARIVDG